MPNLVGGLCHVRASYIQAVKNDPVTDGYLAKSPEGVSTVHARDKSRALALVRQGAACKTKCRENSVSVLSPSQV